MALSSTSTSVVGTACLATFLCIAPAADAAGKQSPSYSRGVAAAGGVQRDFAYHDDRLLRHGQRLGGRLWIPFEGLSSREPLPLLVVLHGLNAHGHLHYLLRDDGFDVRRVVSDLVSARRVRPLIVAAPSQTRQAFRSDDLWVDFDLDDFTRAVARHLPVGLAIDAEQVVVAGFSGAGCNPKAGLFRVAQSPKASQLLLLAAVDTCMDAALGRKLARALAPSTPFLALWQPTWRRDPRAFARALGADDCQLSCADPREGIDWVTSARRAGPRIFVEVAPEPGDAHSDHLDAITRFLHFSLPARLPPSASAAAEGGAR